MEAGSWLVPVLLFIEALGFCGWWVLLVVF